jgi:DNA modification methylase
MGDVETDRVITGDTFEVLPELPTDSIHAVVTDPPYGLAFMGRDWDDFEPKEYQEWCEEWAREVKRVLKPGGHLLAFSGNRTHHRLFTGVEDAGFEIRDTVTWHYGSGFPKATDVSKTIDKRADAEREVVGTREADDVTSGNYGQGDSIDDDKQGERTTYEYTKAATEDAKRWEGFKTALKPATEYVVMARKPFDGATVDCVLDHGTGALNIDGTRIDTEGIESKTYTRNNKQTQNCYGEYADKGESVTTTASTEGRYPSNVVFDEHQAEALDEQTGDTSQHSGESWEDQPTGAENTYGEYNGDHTVHSYGDSGGPSRYFYTSKASRAERTLDGQIDNAHPTVKPIDLMEWLVKLVTRRGQIVLDPFAGSGTTCKAAKEQDRRFIGIEQQAKYADIARVRCGLNAEDPTHVRDDDAQQGLESY